MFGVLSEMGLSHPVRLGVCCVPLSMFYLLFKARAGEVEVRLWNPCLSENRIKYALLCVVF